MMASFFSPGLAANEFMYADLELFKSKDGSWDAAWARVYFREKPREKIIWCPGAIQSLRLKSLIVEFVWHNLISVAPSRMISVDGMIGSIWGLIAVSEQLQCSIKWNLMSTVDVGISCLKCWFSNDSNPQCLVCNEPVASSVWENARECVDLLPLTSAERAKRRPWQCQIPDVCRNYRLVSRHSYGKSPLLIQ